MPIGPSHGSRGGGGFRSGSSGGGSRDRNRGGGSGLGSLVGHVIGAAFLTAGVRRRRRRYEERYGYRPSDEDYNSMPRRKKPTLFLFLAIFTAVIAMFTMLIRNSASTRVKSLNNTIAIMKTDWNEYKDLIDKANLNLDDDEYYLATAEFNTYKDSSYSANPKTPAAYLDFQKDGISYYFIVYEYVDYTGETYIGTTYTQFSNSQLQELNGKINIAYCAKANGEHYSINLNYNLETCAEYNYYQEQLVSSKESARNYLIAFIVELLVIALFIVLYIFQLRKYNKLVSQDEELLFKKQQAEVDKAEAEADAAQQVAQRHNRFCQYCGGQLDADSHTCSSCGAKFSKE